MPHSLICGLIGAGIQGSLSPALHVQEAAAQGLQCRYELLDLDRLGAGIEALPELLASAREKGFRGLNITYPCKQAVLPLLDGCSVEARAIGAVNTVVFGADGLTGHNTDGSGWAWAFRRALPGADVSRVVLLGAGGAGSACADAILRLGASELVIVDREAERSIVLAQRLNSVHAGARARASADIAAAVESATGLIHATPTGMARSPGLAVPDHLLRRNLWVSDVVYVPLETELIRAARGAGCRIMDGGHMAVGQAGGAFKLFTGFDPDIDRMDAHFRQLVAGAT
jgi:shikimate dehydrogenase